MDFQRIPKLNVPRSIRVLSRIANFTSSLARRRDGTINRRIANLFEPRVAAKRTARKGVWTKDVTIDNAKKTGARLFIPVAAESTDRAGETFPVVVYYHGGGFCILTPYYTAYDRFCRRIAREFEVIVVSVHYRRAPEFKCPAAYEDSIEALQWLKDNRATVLPASADLGKCFLMGDSAGGNIVHHTGVTAAGMADALLPLSIRGLIMLQPFFGGEDRTQAEKELKDAPIISVAATDWYWKAFLPAGANRDHPACNVSRQHGPDISPVNFPPSFIAVAGWDILQDRDNEYAEYLTAAGKDVQVEMYENVGHCFFLLGKKIPLTVTLEGHVKDFINKTLNPTTQPVQNPTNQPVQN